MNSGNRSGRIIASALAVLLLLICFSACYGGNTATVPDSASETEAASVSPGGQAAHEITSQETGDQQTESGSGEILSGSDGETEEKPEMKSLTMKIDGKTLTVDWEENESVAALAELVKNQPFRIDMSMYGGFEQVGQLGTDLPRNDVQTTTQAGDIVLYSGDRIVVFYGSNSWAYTRLGHITDKTAAQMKELLGNGNVTLELSAE